MRHLDATELYDLSEAGRALLRDSVRLRREIRIGRIPAVWMKEETDPAGWGFPAPWVDAERGTSALDPEAMRVYWLERLQPPSATGARPARDRKQLAGRALLDRATTARRLCCDDKGLRRLEADGTLVPLRVGTEVFHDEALVTAVAEDTRSQIALDALRAPVKELARFDYVEATEDAPASVPWRRPDPKPAEQAERPRPEAAAPRAYQIPTHLFEGDAAAGDRNAGEPTPPREGLIEADGFDVVDEED